ncbi:Crp/Fnr family transcriptional regulator [Candidatus Saccharibacteria bacterium]|nr:Crp/Fnr family transcriptional regulator [Candidatus Saccharibacteria bacterium]
MDDIQRTIHEYFSAYPPKRHTKGQVLLFPGDPVEAIFYLHSGTVKQYSISKKGDEVTLNIFKPGAFFPMANVVNEVPARFMVEVDSDAEISHVPAADAVRFIRQHPDVLYDLLCRVYRGTEGLLGKLEHLMLSGADDRFLYELLVAAQRFGRPGPDGSTVIDINERSIGERAGLSRETVNRQIKRFKADGLLHVRRGVITIPSLEAVEQALSKND